MVSTGFFSTDEKNRFWPLVDHLLEKDEYFVLTDYQPYVDCQDQVAQAYTNYEDWTRKSILNVARIGKFSSDRTILEYCRDIWKMVPVEVEIPNYNPLTATDVKIEMQV